MCAQFIIKIRAKEVAKRFGIKLGDPDLQYDLRPKGYSKTDLAPVVLAENKSLILKNMNFSLCPSWSKEFPYPWTSYNARMERPKIAKNKQPILDNSGNAITEFIYEIPTWRESFQKAQTCIVPMNAAIESSYFGTHAGKIIQFSITNDQPYYCVGLWAKWLDRGSGETKNSFTLITDDPYEFFFNAGHDRSVFVIEETAAEEWLFNDKWNSKQRFDFLRKHRVSLDWQVTTEREMVRGWEKRAPSEEEVKSIRTWKQAQE